MIKQQIADVLFSDDRVFVPAKLFKNPDLVGGEYSEIRDQRPYVLTAVEPDQQDPSGYTLFANKPTGESCGFFVITDD